MISSSVKKQIQKLKLKKYRKMYHEYLLEGVKNVAEALNHGSVLLIVVDGSRRDEEHISALVKEAESIDIPVEFGNAKDIKQIQSTETFPGVLAIVERPETDIYDVLSSVNGTVLALQGVNDPGNLGTIIRTADWFGIKHIILGEQSTDPFSEKCVRSTMGSIHRVNIYESDNMVAVLKELKKRDFSIYGYTLSGRNIEESQVSVHSNAVHVFGSESHGITSDVLPLLDGELTIPRGAGDAESLNLAVSAGIVMWQLER